MGSLLVLLSTRLIASSQLLLRIRDPADFSRSRDIWRSILLRSDGDMCDMSVPADSFPPPLLCKRASKSWPASVEAEVGISRGGWTVDARGTPLGACWGVRP
jgi:hypothetical protein